MISLRNAATAVTLCAGLAAGVAFAVDPQKTHRPATDQYSIPPGTGRLGNDPFFNGAPTIPTTTPASRDRATNPADADPRLRSRDRYNVQNGHPSPAARDSQTTPRYTPDDRLNPSLVQPELTLPTSRTPKWRLGVYSKDLDTGVRIMQVVPNSAAERAGLEADDLIVAVNGYQVGYINGELYDCAFEFERHADQDGWVRVLVQNNRDRQLVVLPVQLDSRLEKITGTIAYRDRRRLPSGAAASIELREMIRPGAPMVAIARKSVSDLRNVPVSFDIEYDPTQIDPRRTYLLHATITADGRTLYTTKQNYTVLTGNRPRNVAMVVDAVPTSGSGSPYDARDARIEELVGLFRDYLQRDPYAWEMPIWTSELAQGEPLYKAQTELLAGNEFFNHCDRDESVYISRLHELILNRKPYPEEVSYWQQRMTQHNGLRREVAKEVLAAVGALR
ncbi:MAG: YbaY family lipoprotein [Maioricimonas sp. JB049]